MKRHSWIGNLILLLMLGNFTTVYGQENGRIAPLLEGMGDHHHAISTDDPLAQRFFDQGLVLSYGFNHSEAGRSFQEAARLDPECAMCYWGVALVLGPNINLPMDPANVPEAYRAIQNALDLASNASEREQAYIEALATRYSESPSSDRAALDHAYAEAMRNLTQRYPDDLNAASLYAEALMDLMPWNYWEENGEPRPATTEVLTTLESVLTRAPDHPLANHLYIHAVEKERPEQGIAAAERLGGLVPGAGHLVHMPGHIWIRVGRYHDAVLANQRAVLADDEYLAQCHAQGLYPVGYVPHNHHFLWVSAALAGEKKTAINSAHSMGHHSNMMGMPGMEFLQHFAMSLLYAQAFFGEWEDILATPAPPDSLAYPRGVWHFARGLALARTGQPEAAQREFESLQPLAADTTLGKQFGGFNTLQAILQVAEPYLAGEIAAARRDYDTAISFLEEAVRKEDTLIYDEPPPWVLSSRWALGAILLEAGRAAEAERVYLADLDVYPENGWALYGLHRTLITLGKNDEAQIVQRRFETAWQYADIELTSVRF